MIQLGGSGLALCFWHELGRMDRSQALNLLLQTQSDVWVMSSLRRLIELRSAEPGFAKLTDRAVLEAAADLIASGELVLVRTGDRSTGRTGDTSLGKGQSKAGSAPPPPPNQSSQRSSPAPPEEPRVFPANVDAAVMAAVLQNAAQSGAPFCDH
ncbi:MAG: hypothetical protein U0Q18_05585 [Bryobacteraceae bacterium]